MAGRVCGHHGRLRRMPRANPTTVAAVVKHIHYTGVKNLRERHREKEGPLSLRKKLCLNCLKDIEHSTDTCTSSFRCRIEGCGAFHHSLLHPTQLHISASEKKGSADLASAVSTTACTTACTTTGNEDPGTILLQVVPLRVMGADGLVVASYAMLDSGSEITLVDPSLVSSLRLSGQPDRWVLSTVNSQERQEGERVDLVVESLIDEQPQRLQLKGVWSGKELNIPLHHQGITRDKSKWPHLQDVPFPEVARQNLSLIIGTNVPELFIPLEVRCGNLSQATLSQSVRALASPF